MTKQNEIKISDLIKFPIKATRHSIHLTDAAGNAVLILSPRFTSAEMDEVGQFIADALNKSAENEILREENEKLKGILSGDPNLTATKEQRKVWRLSAVRYADKVEAENSILRDAAYHFMHCVECSQEAEKCFEGKQFELVLQGEKKDV